jgi:hypothetical protein
VARLPSAIDIVLRPARAWHAVYAADPSAIRSLAGHAVPLALLPGLAWPVEQALSGDRPWHAPGFWGSLVSTVGFAVASIVLLGLGLYVLSPFFVRVRRWRACLAVAAYASTPVLLTGALLVMPVLIVASVAACIHCFALCYLGVQRVLGCPEEEAAFFVAGACMFALVASLVVGGLCSAAGLI